MQKTPVPDKFSVSGVYKLTCPDRNKAYVGQIGRSFTARYNEHKLAFCDNSHTSRFAQYIKGQVHPFGNIDNTIHILQYHKKGEHFYIHAEYATNNHLNYNQRDLWHPPKGLPPIKKPTLPNRKKVKNRHPYTSALPPCTKPGQLEGAEAWNQAS